jgi:hypothetical protein
MQVDSGRELASKAAQDGQRCNVWLLAPNTHAFISHTPLKHASTTITTATTRKTVVKMAILTLTLRHQNSCFSCRPCV